MKNEGNVSGNVSEEVESTDELEKNNSTDDLEENKHIDH